MRIVYYTGGLLGSGRLVMGMSIGNALERKNIRCKFSLVHNSPVAHIADDFHNIKIPFEYNNELLPTNFHKSALYKTLKKLKPDILLVNHHWFTICNFLNELKCKKIYLADYTYDSHFSLPLSYTTLEFKESDYGLEKPIEETILYEKVTPEIARVMFNRPEKHNCILAPDMFMELQRKLNMAADDEETKVVILGGKGPSFCSGDDLRRAPYEVFGGSPGHVPSVNTRLQGFRKLEGDLVRLMVYYPKILITELHGWVIGIGQMLTLGSDLSIAAENTRMSARVMRTAFAGLEPCMEILSILNIGLKRDRELALTGKDLPIHQAKEWGLVNSVVPDDKLEEETMRWAQAVALMPGDGLANAKAYYSLCLDSLGVPESITGGYIAHTLMTNLKWRPDEFNFLRVKGKVGASDAFKQREDRWAKLGF